MTFAKKNPALAGAGLCSTFDADPIVAHEYSHLFRSAVS